MVSPSVEVLAIRFTPSGAFICREKNGFSAWTNSRAACASIHSNWVWSPGLLVSTRLSTPRHRCAVTHTRAQKQTGVGENVSRADPAQVPARPAPARDSSGLGSARAISVVIDVRVSLSEVGELASSSPRTNRRAGQNRLVLP